MAIFVARVIRDSGEYPGRGPGRVVIEEVLQNVPADLKEAEIETGARWSCYFRLIAGERYVIRTSADKYQVSYCSSSFPVRGNEHVLDAMRTVWKGGSSILVGRVRKSTGVHEREAGVAGVKVVLEQSDGESRKEATTDLEGIYRVPALEAGRYRIAVSKPGFVPDETY